MSVTRNDEDKESPPRGYQASGGLVPVPDPTKLTTDAVALVRDEIEKLFGVQIEHLNTKLKALDNLMLQKFLGVGTEFLMRDTALQAAFKASEAQITQQNTSNQLAAEKSAAAFTKQIDGLDEKIDDLKDRITAMTSHAIGSKDMGAYVWGALGFLVAAATLIVMAVRHV